MCVVERLWLVCRKSEAGIGPGSFPVGSLRWSKDAAAAAPGSSILTFVEACWLALYFSLTLPDWMRP